MPLIQKEDVLAYTTISKVVSRGERLVQDISRAEKRVFAICGHNFSDILKYPEIPSDVKLAAILWTEYYSMKEANKETDGFKSESFDDYSYQKAGNANITEPDTFLLLSPYIAVASPSESKTVLKVRAI